MDSQGRKWTILTNTTPHHAKHSTINIHNERIKVEPLNGILNSELQGSTLEEQRLLQFLFPDSVLSFPIDQATAYLNKLGAFERPTKRITPGTRGKLFFHDTVRRRVDNEAMMANHLNLITKALQNHYPHLECTREWTSQNCSNPMPATHPRKPDLALCDTTALKGQVAGLLSSWSIVHLIVEIKKHTSSTVPPLIANTIRNKALLIFDTQPTHRYLITVWITSVAFGLIYFDRSGEIRASWSSGCHRDFVRLIAGLAFSPESVLGYDPRVTRKMLGGETEIRVNDKSYHVIRCVFKAIVLRGRGTVERPELTPDAGSC